MMHITQEPMFLAHKKVVSFTYSEAHSYKFHSYACISHSGNGPTRRFRATFPVQFLMPFHDFSWSLCALEAWKHSMLFWLGGFIEHEAGQHYVKLMVH